MFLINNKRFNQIKNIEKYLYENEIITIKQIRTFFLQLVLLKIENCGSVPVVQ